MYIFNSFLLLDSYQSFLWHENLKKIIAWPLLVVQKSLGNDQISLLRDLIQNFQRASPPLSYASSPFPWRRSPCWISLRSKRFRTTRTKLGPREGVFSHSGCTKNEARAKKWKERSGGGKRRERLPANPSILKNAPWFSRLSSFIDWQLLSPS